MCMKLSSLNPIMANNACIHCKTKTTTDPAKMLKRCGAKTNYRCIFHVWRTQRLHDNTFQWNKRSNDRIGNWNESKVKLDRNHWTFFFEFRFNRKSWFNGCHFSIHLWNERIKLKTSMHFDLLSNLSSHHLTISIFIILKWRVMCCNLNYHKNGLLINGNAFSGMFIWIMTLRIANSQQYTQIQNRKRSNRQQSSESKQMRHRHRISKWHLVAHKSNWKIDMYIRIHLVFGAI